LRALVVCFSLLILFVAGSVSTAETTSRIVSITIDPTSLVSGGPISVTVATTADIVGVEAAIGPHRVTIPQVESGMYYSAATVPRFPRFIRGRFHVRFFGKTITGETVDADTTVQLN
jgi:hypothetical protein